MAGNGWRALADKHSSVAPPCQPIAGAGYAFAGRVFCALAIVLLCRRPPAVISRKPVSVKAVPFQQSACQKRGAALGPAVNPLAKPVFRAARDKL